MLQEYLSYKDTRIHYHRFGEGKKLLITLHGFGDRGQLFSVLQPALNRHYTVYHGLTKWPHDQFTQKDLLAIINLIRNEIAVEKFDLMGYSFGGRLTMSMLDTLGDQIERLYLIAPDGIQTKWLININLVPRIAIQTLYHLLKQPSWFLYLLDRSFRLGLTSKYVYNFARSHTGTPKRRKRLFGSWLSLAYFKVNRKEVKQYIQAQNIPTYLYFGAQDKIIPL